MKKFYHLLTRSCKGVKFYAPTSYLKPLTSYLFLFSAFLLFCLLPFVAVAQCPDDFTDLESGFVTGYTGYQKQSTYNYTPSDYPPYPPGGAASYPRLIAPFVFPGLKPGRHEKITSPGTDSITGGALSLFPKEGGPVIKLGNEGINFECEALVYEFTPQIDKPILLLNFAVVLSDPSHPFVDQPRFILRVTDTYGNLLDNCTEYDVTSTASIPGFERCMYGEIPINWRPWTKMSVDLSKFVGQVIQVQFITYDCNQGAHFGYCYFTAECVSNTLELEIPCESLSEFSITAPDYFQRYLWSNGDISRTTTFTIDDVKNSQITCKVISDMGCECTLYAYITDDETITQNVTDHSDVICEGETYNLYNFNLPPQEQGTHYYQLAIIDPVKCEQYVSNLKLEVIERYTHYKETICHGKPFNNHNLWSGKIPEYPPTPGVYRDTVPTQGVPSLSTPPYCDFYDVLELVVSVDMKLLTIQGDLSPCTGELVTYSFLGSETLTFFYWEVPPNAEPVGGKYRPQITLYFTDDTPGDITLYGENGCGEGTVTLNITPRQSYDIQLNDQICQGLVYNDNGFNLGVQNKVGFSFYSKHLQSSHGCDSTITLILNVLPMHSVRIEPIDTAICNPDDAVTLWAFIDEDEYQDNNCDDPDQGNYRFAFMYNCGYSYSWSATPPDISVTDITTPYITVTPDVTTTYTITVSSDIGCDATASQTVVVNTGNVVINDTICFGETYSAYGITESTSGKYEYGSITTYDCVVPVTVNLTVLPEAKSEIIETVCSGDTYTDDDGFYFELYGEGSYIDTIHFISHKGCDSLVIFNFTIKPQKETFINDNICQFETYNKNGFDTVQNFAGLQILTKVFPTSEGCDSLVVIRLNVYPNPVNVVDFGVVLGLAGTTTTFTNWSIYYDEGMIAAWEWYLGDESSPFATTKDASYIFTEEGDYTVTLKVKGINGCWAQITKDITIDWCPTPTIIVDEPEIEVCGLETVTITGSFEDADILKIKTLSSNGRKAKLTVSGNNFTITYSPTIANVGKVVEIIITATDSTLPCAVATETIFITVKPKPTVRTNGECIPIQQR